MQKALQAPHRQAQNVERDRYRHPLEVLRFFDVAPTMGIVEIWPATGWWTEILAPYTRNQGSYYAAGFALSPQWRKDIQLAFINKQAAAPHIYDHIINTQLSVPGQSLIAPNNSADRVLTFRNVHNWMKGGYAQEVFTLMYQALKPGGILGLVEHRAKPQTSLKNMIASGYVTEAYIKTLAENAGFIFIQAAEINANAKDSREHEKGVWTLLPSLRLCKALEADKFKPCEEKYQAIGESDRMTLTFQKPL